LRNGGNSILSGKILPLSSWISLFATALSCFYLSSATFTDIVVAEYIIKQPCLIHILKDYMLATKGGVTAPLRTKAPLASLSMVGASNLKENRILRGAVTTSSRSPLWPLWFFYYTIRVRNLRTLLTLFETCLDAFGAYGWLGPVYILIFFLGRGTGTLECSRVRKKWIESSKLIFSSKNHPKIIYCKALSFKYWLSLDFF